jgi:hypothetical protein
MEKQYRAELDNCDQTVDSLRKKLAERDYDSRSSVIGALVPTDPSWKLQIQKRDEVRIKIGVQQLTSLLSL